VAQNLAQVHGNHEELLQGLNASEFNLRAHQKVLNAMAMDMERIARALELDPPLEHLQMADVPVAPQKGDEIQQTVRRIDWPGYHTEVEADLKRIAEIEKQRAEAEKKAAEEEAERLRKEKEAQAAADLESAERAKEEPEPETATAEAPPETEDPEYPEGASVFGGDV
jgi:membrane protein involved in colicin uptake